MVVNIQRQFEFSFFSFRFPLYGQLCRLQSWRGTVNFGTQVLPAFSVVSWFHVWYKSYICHSAVVCALSFLI